MSPRDECERKNKKPEIDSFNSDNGNPNLNERKKSKTGHSRARKDGDIMKSVRNLMGKSPMMTHISV